MIQLEENHYLYDTVRGTGTGKMEVITPSTNESLEGSKSTEAMTHLDGFVRDGFRLDFNVGGGTDCINNSGDNFVAWCNLEEWWKQKHL